MLQKTRGIVFKVTDYQEASVITQIFTEKFGLQSYIINGIKKPKAKITRNMLQPLHLLDMIVYHKGNGSIERIKELKSTPVLYSIPYDVVKSSLVMFLNEVLYKALKQQSPDEHLFNYIFHSIEWLDNRPDKYVNFHLVFLIGLTRFLGFYPQTSAAAASDYFDMRDGVFTRYKPEGLQFFSAPHTNNFYKLLQTNYEDMDTVKLSNEERRYLIVKLLDYFAMHVEGFGNIRSREILEEVLG